MADTLPDVQLSRDSYTDLYAASGIAVGAKVLVQNKSNGIVNYVISAAQPTDDDNSGNPIEPLKFLEVDAGENGLWAKGAGNINIQQTP